MKISTLKRHLSRANKVVAPEGWAIDINLDLPLWRYFAVGALFGVVPLFLAGINRGWSPSLVSPGEWALSAVILLLFLLPPIMRRVYLRRKCLNNEQRTIS